MQDRQTDGLIVSFSANLPDATTTKDVDKISRQITAQSKTGRKNRGQPEDKVEKNLGGNVKLQTADHGYSFASQS